MGIGSQGNKIYNMFTEINLNTKWVIVVCIILAVVMVFDNSHCKL